MTKAIKTMQDLTKNADIDLVPFKKGSIIEVEITGKSKKRVFVDVKGLNVGMIPEKEFSSDVFDLQKGDKVLAYILSMENEDGYVVLSLKKADRERFQKTLSEKFTSGEPVSVRVKEANRGGLIVEYGRQEGFLPSSQLASSHYPRVGNDKDKILAKLRELIGQNIKVKVITYEPSAGKVIFSEKEAGDIILEEKIAQFKVGDIKEGTVTGIVNFGLFIDLEGLEGLVHISEISWDKISDLNKMFKVGDKIKAKIISLDNKRVSLSIKSLTPDPWLDAISEYKEGEVVKGKVTKISPFGAFVEISKDISGLLHVSQFGQDGKESMEDAIEVGKNYEFKILNIEPEVHKINLALVETEKKSAKKAAKKATKKAKK